MRLTEHELLEQALSNLKVKIDSASDILIKEFERNYCDAIVQIKGIDFACEVKSNVTNSNFNTILHQLFLMKERVNMPLLLVTQYIYPKLLNEFSKNGISVLDCAGNCFIRYDNLLLVIKGEKNNPVREVIGRAFQEAGIKLIFYFLTIDHSVNNPYRIMQQYTNVSLGAIKNIMAELIQANFILITKNGRFLKNKEKLLERWIVAYNQILKPKLLLGHMAFINNEKREKWMTMTLPKGMYWGGESGAYITDSYLLPGKFEIYTEIPTNTLLSTGSVIPKNDGEITIYQKFWKDESTNNIVPILLIYADLMGSGNSRCLEAAQRIYEHELSDFKR